jgi:hypothetical protein
MRRGAHPDKIFLPHCYCAGWRGENQMKFHWPQRSITIAIVSVGVMVGAATPAVAAIHKGSNPNSAYCKLEKTNLANNSPVSAKEKAVSKAIEAGNWKLAQKGLEALDTQTNKVEQQLISALSSAPAKVQAAGRQAIKLVPAEFNAIKNSTSVAQFEKKIGTVTSGKKFTQAESILEAYDTAQCGL